MITKDYYTDRYPFHCPNCVTSEIEMIECIQKDEITIREYECMFCGGHWKVVWNPAHKSRIANKFANELNG